MDCEYKFKGTRNNEYWCKAYNMSKRPDDNIWCHFPICSDKNCPLKHPELLEGATFKYDSDSVDELANATRNITYVKFTIVNENNKEITYFNLPFMETETLDDSVPEIGDILYTVGEDHNWYKLKILDIKCVYATTELAYQPNIKYLIEVRLKCKKINDEEE